MKKNIIKILVFIFVPFILIVLLYAIIEVYKKQKPGLYFEYKCGKKGLPKLKNEGAEKAICSGIYIPYGVKLEKKDYLKVLEKMGELDAGDKTFRVDMKKLAEEGVKQTEIT